MTATEAVEPLRVARSSLALLVALSRAAVPCLARPQIGVYGPLYSPCIGLFSIALIHCYCYWLLLKVILLTFILMCILMHAERKQNFLTLAPFP